MRKGIFKYPDNRFGGHLPKRIPEPSETRLSDNSVTHGFNDFMTQCRHSSLVRRTASPQNRIRGDPPVCLFTETDNAVIQFACKQKTKSSTIKLNRTMSKEIFVAFATQKGGIGKGYNVAVVDCDDPQHSIHGLREHETGLIDSSTYFKALACDHFRKIRKNAYTIIKSDAVNALDDAERMVAAEDVKPDVVFFDMPGTLRSNGVIKTLSQMDYIFTPLSADRFVVESTLKFVTMFRDRLMTTGQAKTKGLYLFWTMVDGRERNDLYGIDEELLLASIGRRTLDGTSRPTQEVPVAPAGESTAVPEPPPAPPVTREKAQRDGIRRKRPEEDYNELFLRRNEIKTRQCVYISRDVHGKILKIVNDIAGGDISVGGYVDTVLRRHLEQHKERINELYKKQREDLI